QERIEQRPDEPQDGRLVLDREVARDEAAVQVPKPPHVAHPATRPRRDHPNIVQRRHEGLTSPASRGRGAWTPARPGSLKSARRRWFRPTGSPDGAARARSDAAPRSGVRARTRSNPPNIPSTREAARG